MKKIAALLFLTVVCLGVGKLLYLSKKGFSARRVERTLSSAVTDWNKSADPAIKQKFYYLGRGRQCFAFASEDGEYVLKLPRSDIYQTPFWMRALPCFETRAACQKEKLRRKHFIMDSFRIAANEMKKETGTLSLHLDKTFYEGRQIHLVDPLGISLKLPADRVSFILQKKQPILMKAFADALEKEQKADAVRILAAFIDVVLEREKKGIGNKDGSFLKNYGYDGKLGYQIDIGSFFKRSDGLASIHDSLHPVRAWLTETNPDMLGVFDHVLQMKLQGIRHLESN